MPSVRSPPQSSPVSDDPVEGSLCVMWYSTPGTVDYAWSVATYVSFLYTPVNYTTITLLSGAGQRVYTNRFGVSFSTNFKLVPPTNASQNLLYLQTMAPLDASGITLALQTPVQLPGGNPFVNWTSLTVNYTDGLVVENGGLGVDRTGVAWVSAIPGFVNLTIGSSDINAFSADYDSCTASITRMNGLVAPTQPSVRNSAMQFNYSYNISDGSTYSVLTELVVNCTTHFGTFFDQLGNPHQVIANVTGTRLYTHIPTGATLLSTVSYTAGKVARFYPYTLIASSPGVYSSNTVPHWDGAGVELNLSPAVPANGMAPRQGTQFDSQTLQITKDMSPRFVLTESHAITAPLPALQQQQYTFTVGQVDEGMAVE